MLAETDVHAPLVQRRFANVPEPIERSVSYAEAAVGRDIHAVPYRSGVALSRQASIATVPSAANEYESL